MVKITARIDGMMCSMCESHVNDAIRKAFPVKKVTASHKKGQAEILAEEDISDAALKAALDDCPRDDHRHGIIHACLPTEEGMAI